MKLTTPAALKIITPKRLAARYLRRRLLAVAPGVALNPLATSQDEAALLAELTTAVEGAVMLRRQVRILKDKHRQALVRCDSALARFYEQRDKLAGARRATISARQALDSERVANQLLLRRVHPVAHHLARVQR